jgi:hypothetical protein
VSLYADILRRHYAVDDDILFDEESKTWTVVAWELDGEDICGIADKELALAIVRAIRAGYDKGSAAGQYS